MPSRTRGVYRGIFSSLIDDPDFQALSARGRHVLLTARLCRQAGAAAIWRYYPALLAQQCGCSERQLEAALEELERAGWIERDETRTILWIVNGLRYDPTLRLADEKHRKSVERALAELPKRAIVLRFCDYYKITRPFEDPSKTHLDLALRVPIPSTDTEYRIPIPSSDREGSSKTLPASPASAGPVPSSALGSWGTVEALVQLYNAQAPDNVPTVEKISPGRRKKAQLALRLWPDRQFWDDVFSAYRQSKFLSGRTRPANGHENFSPDFDWLLARGKDGTENVVKVHDGKYRD